MGETICSRRAASQRLHRMHPLRQWYRIDYYPDDRLIVSSSITKTLRFTQCEKLQQENNGLISGGGDDWLVPLIVGPWPRADGFSVDGRQTRSLSPGSQIGWTQMTLQTTFKNI